MSRGKTHLRNALFAATIVAALGFGGAQAFASPSGSSVRACTYAYCVTYCTELGYSRGKCLSTAGICSCWNG